MASPYIGEIRLVGFTFAPVGWAHCDGQLQSISQNEALFAILGTIYGGDGVQTFGLPDLRGRVPMHWGNGAGGFNTVIGEVQGSEDVTLLTSQIPAHNHSVSLGASTAEPTSNRPKNTLYPAQGYYATTVNVDGPMGAAIVGLTGGSQPHENRQPFLGLNFIIALEGIFPSRN